MKTTYFSSSLFRKYQLGTIMFISSLFLLCSSCTKNFEKYNTDNSSISDNALLPDNNYLGLFFPAIQQNIFGAEQSIGDYQLGQNLNADCYSGYMMSADPFRSNLNNLTYFLVDGWNSQIYTNTYADVVSPIKFLVANRGLMKVPDFYAVALILQVDVIDRCTDRYGPIPYSKLVASNSGAVYDAQSDVYNLMFLQLDTAVTNLQTYIAANPTLKPFQKFDLIFGGDYTLWLKLANSLRLRLAMRISKIAPDLAKTQGQKALNMTANGGLLSASTENALMTGYGYQNPLTLITSSWTDISMSASMESIMVGYKDPRLSKYFLPATVPTSVVPANTYKGIRIGFNLPSKSAKTYVGFSQLNYTGSFTQNSPMVVMTAAEVWFLRAEAALRGWSTETPQTDYETGINTSMAQWAVSSNTYLTDNSSKPIDYLDPITPANNIPAVSTTTIAWDNSASNEQKLEKIITQKWIAMYPEGCEAWAEYRRTGYPRLFPVVINNSGGTISTPLQIRRLAYPQSEYNSNKTNVDQAVSLLGGLDNGGTPVWWDTNKGQANPVNF